jgi:IclR family acetate operon transcriptional repressor
VLGKTLDVLEALADARRLSLGELSRRTHVNRTSAYRILATLATRGYIAKDADQRVYLPGPSLLAISAAFLSGRGLIHIARPAMEALSADMGETVNLGVLNGDRVLYLDMVEGHQGLRMAAHVGSHDAVHCTALGKALLAFTPAEDLQTLLASCAWEQRTRRTCKSADALRRDLARVHRRGFAVDDEENERGVRCLGVPIRDGQGRPIAALSVSGPTARLPRSAWPRIARRLNVAAHAIERRMGGGARITR